MINFDKNQDGLVPAIIQDATDLTVLMLGYMNRAAYEQTKSSGRVCFFSRSKNRLWTKGESSGNFLQVESITADCDHDALLIKAKPVGNVCHTGRETCFGNKTSLGFLRRLETTVIDRKKHFKQGSYTSALFEAGINKICQKVGEEAVELVIEAKDDQKNLLLNEAADLLYHFLVLLAAKDVTLQNIEDVLLARHS